ncbi:MAG: hypothetical protein HYZ53_09610 [Planctomycetes bacterium]|nr:hypothetical protein [Planctomycetota bacterium]
MRIPSGTRRGTALPEYVILVSLVAVGVLGCLTAYGRAVARRYQGAFTALQGTTPAKPERPGIHGEENDGALVRVGDKKNHVDLGHYTYEYDAAATPGVAGGGYANGEFNTLEFRHEEEVGAIGRFRFSKGEQIDIGNVSGGGGAYAENSDDILVVKVKTPGVGVSAIKGEKFRKMTVRDGDRQLDVEGATTFEGGGAGFSLPVNVGGKLVGNKRTGEAELQVEVSADPVKTGLIATGTGAAVFGGPPGALLGLGLIVLGFLLKSSSVGFKGRVHVGKAK